MGSLLGFHPSSTNFIKAFNGQFSGVRPISAETPNTVRKTGSHSQYTLEGERASAWRSVSRRAVLGDDLFRFGGLVSSRIRLFERIGVDYLKALFIVVIIRCHF